MATTTTGRVSADPVLSVAVAGAWLLLQLRPLALALVALVLTLAGWRPACPAAVPAVVRPLAAAAAPVAIARPSGRVTVVELRRMARAAGLPSLLSRSGRRAELLAALGMEG
jgi:hypothetical protein